MNFSDSFMNDFLHFVQKDKFWMFSDGRNYEHREKIPNFFDCEFALNGEITVALRNEKARQKDTTHGVTRHWRTGKDMKHSWRTGKDAQDGLKRGIAPCTDLQCPAFVGIVEAIAFTCLK